MEAIWPHEMKLRQQSTSFRGLGTGGSEVEVELTYQYGHADILKQAAIRAGLPVDEFIARSVSEAVERIPEGDNDGANQT